MTPDDERLLATWSELAEMLELSANPNIYQLIEAGNDLSERLRALLSEREATPDLTTLIFEAIGEASMCWDETPKGIFDSTRAKAIGDRLVASLPSPPSREALVAVGKLVAKAVVDDEVALRLAGLTVTDLGLDVLAGRIVDGYLAGLSTHPAKTEG